MRIGDFVSLLPGAHLTGDPEADVSAVVYDSRKVRPGELFVAVPGLTADGHDYLNNALSAGASAFAVQADHETKWRPVLGASTPPTLVLPDTRVALAPMAGALRGWPARKLGVIGITGTDGKTSLSHLVEHVLAAAGHRPGLVTTAECRIGERHLLDTGRFTTPEAPELQSMLAEMVAAGCDWAVLEATSHGLAQRRLDCCDFDIAAVTTIGSDHLDFHGSREAYVAAKARLFEMLLQGHDKGIMKTAVLNADDPEFERFQRLSGSRVLSYGVHSPADISADGLESAGWATRFTVRTPEGSMEAAVHGPGEFGVQNALAALAIASAVGVSFETAGSAVASWQGAPGRMQLVDQGQPFTVVVDFAHAPDSLRRVLGVLREYARGRLIAVFGCIGERERDRRFAMGQVAAEAADFTVVTDDNPYTEDRDAIISEIVAGLEAAGRRAGHDFAVIPDRREAIAHALAMAVDEDLVLLAGKGHETLVHLPGGSYECDDREIARAVLGDLARAPGTS